MRKIFIFLGLVTFFIAHKVKAVCAVCTISICLGVGLSRWLGIDDVISGLWIGGLIVSLIIWMIGWFEKRKFKIKLQELFISIIIYSFITSILYIKGMIGLPNNTIFCIDKLLFGISFGSIIFLMGTWFNGYLKQKNNNKAYFPFQKVVLPVAFLLISSIIFYSIL